MGTDSVPQSAIEIPTNLKIIILGEPEMLYSDSELPFTFDISCATVKKNSSEIYTWHTYGNITHKFYGPLEDPFRTFVWAKPNAELIDFNGKADSAYDNIWIANIYIREKGDYLAFCHIEKNVWTNTQIQYAIGLAYSTDQGETWVYCGEILRPQLDTRNIGGVPYLIVGDDIYVYYNECAKGSSIKRLCVAKANLIEVLSAAESGEVAQWLKFNAGHWNEDGLSGVGSNIIGDGEPYWDFHSDAAYNRTINKYMLTIQTHNVGQLLLYTSGNGIDWQQQIVLDETDDNDYIHAYSFFVGLQDSSDDCNEVGSEFYIYFPNKDWPDNYAYDEFYRVLVGFSNSPSGGYPDDMDSLNSPF